MSEMFTVIKLSIVCKQLGKTDILLRKEKQNFLTQKTPDLVVFGFPFEEKLP